MSVSMVSPVFFLTGWPSTSQHLPNAFQHFKDKWKLAKQIKSLGGRVLEAWDSSVTHVISYSPALSEGLMVGLVAGCWVCNRRYVTHCSQAGRWEQVWHCLCRLHP